MHPLIPDMLSELAFNREVGDPPSQPSTFSSNKNKSASQSFLSSWSGLFCLTFEDPDMFYDAEEMIHGHNGQVHTDGKGTRPAPARATSSKIAVLCRGGSDNNYFCWPRDDVSHLHSPVNMNHLNRNKNWSDCEGDRSRAPDVAPFPPHRKIHNSMNDSFHSANGSMRHICDFNLPPHNSFQPNPSMASMISSADEIYSQPVEIDSYGRVYSHDKHHSSPPPPTPSQQQANGRISTVSSSLSAQALPSHNPFTRILPPPAPQELPSRFLRAGKGDPVQGRRRYEATLAWRKEHGIDTLLLQAHPHFELIKKHYPHYYHLTGRNGEPVFFEQPPKTDLQALKAGGINLDLLVRHYTMVTEFQWQYIERDDHAQSITVLDLDGIRMIDFVGDWYVFPWWCRDMVMYCGCYVLALLQVPRIPASVLIYAFVVFILQRRVCEEMQSLHGATLPRTSRACYCDKRSKMVRLSDDRGRDLMTEDGTSCDAISYIFPYWFLVSSGFL